MKTVYIAGPITGIADYKDRFHAAHDEAWKLAGSNGFVLSPHRLPVGRSQQWYMVICCDMVFRADTIFMLKGWENSKGARAEHALAVACGKEIAYQ